MSIMDATLGLSFSTVKFTFGLFVQTRYVTYARKPRPPTTGATVTHVEPETRSNQDTTLTKYVKRKPVFTKLVVYCYIILGKSSTRTAGIASNFQDT